MFIRTESTPSPETMRFCPGETVLASGTASFGSPDSAEQSPLAQRLFAVPGVAGVVLDGDGITVAKAPGGNWDELRMPVLMAITAHYESGEPAVDAAVGAADAVGARVQELLDTRIKPALAQTGGNAVYRGFDAGIVYLELSGGAFAHKDAIANMLRHYLPEIAEIRDYRDAAHKPGMETPEAAAIAAILADQVNPAVAAHGGHITLIDIQGDTAYIRLEGGCQGCGMANVTLKQGVETAIKQAAPSIATVLDVTDHAGGTNPYYQSSSPGVSPF